MVKTKTRLWYFCGQTRNRRGKNHSDFQFWWTVRGSNPRPRRCERRALPAELTAQIGHLSIKKVMKNGFLRYSILRGKSEKPDRKLEGKIGQVMEVHMDANRTLSQLSYGPKSAIFQSKSYEKRIFEIFNFEGKVRKIGRKIGRKKRAGDGSPYGCERSALPAELRAQTHFATANAIIP